MLDFDFTVPYNGDGAYFFAVHLLQSLFIKVIGLVAPALATDCDWLGSSPFSKCFFFFLIFPNNLMHFFVIIPAKKYFYSDCSLIKYMPIAVLIPIFNRRLLSIICISSASWIPPAVSRGTLNVVRIPAVICHSKKWLHLRARASVLSFKLQSTAYNHYSIFQPKSLPQYLSCFIWCWVWWRINSDFVTWLVKHLVK